MREGVCSINYCNVILRQRDIHIDWEEKEGETQEREGEMGE